MQPDTVVLTADPQPRTAESAATAMDARAAKSYAETLPSRPESAAVARALVRAVLEGWHLTDLTDCAMLIMTELVSNAVKHACGMSIRVTVSLVVADRLRLAVEDGDHRRPRLKPSAPYDEQGRGLEMVDATSADWGVNMLPQGKQVWAECGPAS